MITYYYPPRYVVVSSRYLVPLRSKYIPLQTILEHPQFTFPPKCDGSRFTIIKNNGPNDVAMYSYIYIFWIANWKTKIKFITNFTCIKLVHQMLKNHQHISAHPGVFFFHSRHSALKKVHSMVRE